LCALCDNNTSIIEIYNSLGQIIYSQNIHSSNGNINETISISEGSCGNNLTSGIYIVQISDSESIMEQILIIE
ncbi:MAG: T9SS type A sorting domain-containing protein, partial [Chitinophagales bacterium]